jgi:hypothetical protein
MLVVYLITLIVGGALLTVTLVLGGDHHGHVHVGGDGHGGADAHGDQAGAADAVLGWFPLTSLRFWTFFAAFFGLAGTLLTTWVGSGRGVTIVMSIGAGYLSGLMMDRAMRILRRSDSDSTVGAGDLVGAGVKVLVAVAAGKTGKVRAHLKGRTVDLLADTSDPAEIGTGQHAMVLSMRDDGHVVITRETETAE